MLAAILISVFLGILLLLLIRKRRNIARLIYSRSTGTDKNYPTSFEETENTPGYLSTGSALRQIHAQDKSRANLETRQRLYTSSVTRRRAVITPTNLSQVP
ncbi:hypothetical protein ENVG_00311 [Emiliania huxleyi virus 84]|nr:hypothetical protein ENVG_00311 [Emiliania huxleyi virus 84]AEP15340.1 hypothetical protein EOVG_00403 [Emiliania huxleyi virus 88]